MNEPSPSFDPNELSEDDLAVLRAFDAPDSLEVPEGQGQTTTPTDTSEALNMPVQEHFPADHVLGRVDTRFAPSDLLQDMFALFATEADEDIATMWQALHQLEYDDDRKLSSSLITLKNAAHKLKGTAGTVGCDAMSRIARHVELGVKLVQDGAIPSMTGLVALVHAVRALEVTLYSTIIEGRESDTALSELEADWSALNIPEPHRGSLEAALDRRGESEAGESQHVGLESQTQASLPLVGVMGVEWGDPPPQLLHTEQLEAQRAPMENAVAEVQTALQELHTAQARLQHLETLLFTQGDRKGPPRHPLPPSPLPRNGRSRKVLEEERPPSSLVARILDEATERTGQAHQRKSRYGHSREYAGWAVGGVPPVWQLGTAPFWDELEMDRYTEGDLLVRSLSEAIADVATASSQVRLAFARLDRTVQTYMSVAASVRGDVLSFLGLPRSHGMVQGLLVRAGNQRVVVPYSQVLRIGYSGTRESALSTMKNPLMLSDLLGFPGASHSAGAIRPLLIVQQDGDVLAVQVNEILGEVELAMRPLVAHLQRPGLLGTVIDPSGNVLLVLDLSELVKQEGVLPRASRWRMFQGERKQLQSAEQAFILIADDSVYMRLSLLQTLSRAGYRVREVRDGMEALEQVLAEPPDLLLLDIEMPKLNGYEVLNIIRTYPDLQGLKVVMVTSRSLEKYQQRALELGAHAYLTKPCAEDVLLKTIQQVLTS